MDKQTGLPVVNFQKCVGCGACVKTCPRGLLSLSTVMAEQRQVVHVACSSHDKGPVAMKACEVSCIGCGKCVKTCESKAITIDRFCAKINTAECTRCGKCVEVCPRKSILIDQIAGYEKS